MASACSSSVSIQKSNTIQSLPSNTSSSCSNRRKSCDTVCSSNSRCFFQKKKPINPLATSVRPHGSRTDQNVVRQRVMSAKLIKLRNLQSQLNDANFHLMELAKENRALKTLQRRQDKALNNYEGINADLPRLIKAHGEENRTLTELNRSVKKTVKELSEQLKVKDEELISMRDQLKHLTNLAKDKHLEEREKLRAMLEEARKDLKDSEAEISMLNRKLMVETKNAKQKLNAEITNHKKCQRDLAEALNEINRLSENNNFKPIGKRRFVNINTRQSHSMVSLNNASGSDTNLQEINTKENESDVKLQPITSRHSGGGNSTTMQSPNEIIKARLSGNANKFSDVTQLTKILRKLNTDEKIIRKGLNGTKPTKSRATKLETLTNTRVEQQKEVNNGVEKEQENGIENCDNESVVSSSLESPPNFDENCNEELQKTELESEKIISEVAKLDKLDDELRDKKVDDILLKEDDYDLVNKIWSEEFTFRTIHRNSNGNLESKHEPVVEDKKKLLATLRDIDNGKSIENVCDDEIVTNSNTNLVDEKKSRLIKELFG